MYVQIEPDFNKLYLGQSIVLGKSQFKVHLLNFVTMDLFHLILNRSLNIKWVLEYQEVYLEIVKFIPN